MTQPKVHVKKEDTVVVISGKDKGKKGKVLEVLPKENRVIVEGINKVKRHTRPSQKMQQGGIIEKESPIHASNVMYVCDSCKKGTRTGIKIKDNGQKVRFCKKCNSEID